MQMCNQFQNSLRMLGACGRRPSLLLYTTCWTKDGAVRLSIFESQSLWKEWEFTMIYDEYWWIKEVLPMLSCWLWHFSSSMQNRTKEQTFVDISKLGNFLNSKSPEKNCFGKGKPMDFAHLEGPKKHRFLQEWSPVQFVCWNSVVWRQKSFVWMWRQRKGTWAKKNMWTFKKK